MHKYKNFLLAALICACIYGCTNESRPPWKDQPNVILVVVDALRADRLGSYGNVRPVSPNIDSYAKGGVIFKDAYSHASHTKLSVASIFTGLLPPDHGVRHAAEVDEVLSGGTALVSDAVHPDYTTLAEVMSERGYQTCGIISNPHIMHTMGFGQGFRFYRYVPNVPRAKLINNIALDWFEKVRPKKYFLYLHYMDVHAPYHPPEEYRRRAVMGRASAKAFWENGPYTGEVESGDIEYTKALYDAQITYWDHEFKVFMDELRRAGRLMNTVVIVTSDHGEEFYDHGGFGHGYTVYNEMIKVPLIVFYPDYELDAGVVREERVMLTDLYPTISAMAGEKALPELSPGTDLFKNGLAGGGWLHDLFTGHTRMVYAETFYGEKPRAYYQGRHKLVYNEKSGEHELYDLLSDPEEKIDIAGEKSARGLYEGLDRIMARKPVFGKSPEAVMSKDALQDLRSLGYISE